MFYNCIQISLPNNKYKPLKQKRKEGRKAPVHKFMDIRCKEYRREEREEKKHKHFQIWKSAIICCDLT